MYICLTGAVVYRYVVYMYICLARMQYGEVSTVSGPERGVATGRSTHAVDMYTYIYSSSSKGFNLPLASLDDQVGPRQRSRCKRELRPRHALRTDHDLAS